MMLILIITIFILLGFLVFIKPTLGLMIILLSTLFLPEVQFGAVATAVGKQREISLRPEDFFLVLVALGWLAERTIRRQAPSIIATPLTLPIIALSILMVFSTLLGIMAGTTTAGAGFFYTLKRIQYFVVFFLVIGNIRTLKDIRNNINLLFLFAAGVAIWAIVEYFISEKRITGPFLRMGQPPILGGFFLIIIFLAIGFLIRYQSFRIKLPMLIIIILSFLVIIFTRTRSSYVGGAIGLAVVSILHRKPYLLLVPLALIILTESFFSEPIKEAAYSIQGVWRRPAEQSLAPSWDARVGAWEAAWPEIKNNPLFGLGAGSYPLGWIDSQYVIDAVYMGLLGVAAFIWLLIRIFKNIYPLSKIPLSPESENDKYISALSAGYLGGLVALLVHGIAVTNFYTVRTMIPFWFLSGLVMVAYHIYHQKMSPDDLKA
ncbi:MAG: O-antigen ligase family protein [Planctomycetes bacterium]|nr:O-antigen ligase family protein [Planctomycetota bacterium]